MAVFIQRDVTCNRCDKTYPTYTGERELSILFHHTFFSICPECSLEVVKAMGYKDVDHIRKLLTGIKEAETENNRKRRVDNGEVCGVCTSRFQEETPRVRESIASNVPAWHLECYPKRNEVQRGKGKGMGGS